MNIPKTPRACEHCKGGGEIEKKLDMILMLQKAQMQHASVNARMKMELMDILARSFL